MASGLRSDLKLTTGPDYPDHVTVDRDGIAYAIEVERDDQDLPARFTGIARPDDREAPPWSTLLFGLETGRYDMRDRFLAQLRADAATGRELDRYGAALAAAFHQIFGGRGATPDLAGFLQFVEGALAGESDPAVRTQLDRGLREREPGWVDPRIDRAGAIAVTFGTETGHVPADHPSVLYWMSALVPGWTNVHFGQIDSESEDADPYSPHQLDAWWAGYHLRVPADNRGDFVDPWSCAGLVNVILRDIARSEVRIYVDLEDEAARVVGAPRSVLRALRSARVIGHHDD